jgi:hypothetical protein
MKLPALRAQFIIAMTLTIAALTMSGCVPQEEDSEDLAFQRAIPMAQSLSITVPDSAGSGQLAVGDKSILYELTRQVSTGVNAHVAVALAYPSIIALFPPSERGENFRVWGPSEPKGLERVSWGGGGGGARPPPPHSYAVTSISKSNGICDVE